MRSSAAVFAICSRVKKTSKWSERRAPSRMHYIASTHRSPMSPCSMCGCPTAAASSCAANFVHSTRELACLMLTSYDDDEALFEAIVAGAAGYVLKQVKGNDIIDAVRRVGDGQILLDPAMTARVVGRLRNGADGGPAPGRPEQPGTADPRTAGRRQDQSTDRRRDVPGREDGQELRQQPPGQDGDEPSNRGRRLRSTASRAAQPPVAATTLLSRHRRS